MTSNKYGTPAAAKARGWTVKSHAARGLPS